MYVAIDADGFIVATYKGLGANPLETPPGGYCSNVSQALLDSILGALEAGQRPKLEGGTVVVETPPAPSSDEILKQARAEKLIEAAAITHVRDEEDKDTGIYTPVGLRHLDIAVLFLLGELKPTDTILVRNNKTHNNDTITLNQWVDSLRETFQLRQALRAQEQAVRDQIESVVTDGTKTDDEKIATIQGVTVSMPVKGGGVISGK